MPQILSIWSTLTPMRRIAVVAATLLMFAAVLGLSQIASQPRMDLLFSGLEPAAAGDVVAALDQTDVRYEVRNGAIFVESAQRDMLRMTLAASGLPATNGQGYELLDQLSGFGTTSQMFDAAYWRAKEGELARTIMASPRVKAARVHISNPSSNPFQRDQTPTASVTVTTTNETLSSAQARALKFLVASAVAGLSPDDVSIIDGRGGLVMSGDEAGQGTTGGEDRAAELRRNIQRILEARVGYGNAVVEVNVETVTAREAITERRFDPDNRVAVSSDTEERTTTSRGTQGGSVTVASNLPGGDAGGGENSSSSDNSESRERVNYEVSETTREVINLPGAIKRVSVAVLVDGIRSVDPETNTAAWQPRPEAEIEALRELVASAVGFDEARGDTITLKTMEFEAVIAQEAATVPSALRSLDLMTLIQIGVLSFVSLALGLFVVRPILASHRPVLAVAALAPPDWRAMSSPAGPAAPRFERPGRTLGALAPQSNALTGEIEDDSAPFPQMAFASSDAMGAAMDSAPRSNPEADPVARLRSLIEDRREESVEILRSWMEDQEEQT